MQDNFDITLTRRVINYYSNELTNDELNYLLDSSGNVFNLFKKNHESCNIKYSEFSPWNVDQAIHFYIFFQSFLYKKDQIILSEKLYYFLRTNFCLDIFPSRNLPGKFLLVHPIGTILGAAEYRDYLVAYQGVTVGGNPRLEYPIIGERVILYAGAKVIGRSFLGDNVVIGAGVIINNEHVDRDTIVYLDADQKRCYRKNSHNNRERFFR